MAVFHADILIIQLLCCISENKLLMNFLLSFDDQFYSLF
jgi:hypothetical protein